MHDIYHQFNANVLCLRYVPFPVQEFLMQMINEHFYILFNNKMSIVIIMESPLLINYTANLPL